MMANGTDIVGFLILGSSGDYNILNGRGDTIADATRLYEFLWCKGINITKLLLLDILLPNLTLYEQSIIFTYLPFWIPQIYSRNHSIAFKKSHFTCVRNPISLMWEVQFHLSCEKSNFTYVRNPLSPISRSLTPECQGCCPSSVSESCYCPSPPHPSCDRSPTSRYRSPATAGDSGGQEQGAGGREGGR